MTDEISTFEPPEHLVSRKNQRRAKVVARYVTLGLILLFIAFPFYWMFVGSIRPTTDMFVELPTLYPSNVTLAHFSELVTETRFPTFFKNSLIVGIAATIVSTVMSTLGGYGLARADFRGKKNLARSVLFAYMIPAILLALPLYRAFYRLDLLNSYVSLTMAHVAVSLPFCTWVMWQYFQTLPVSYEESAWINGASLTRTLFDVVLPMAKPGAVAVAIFAFSFSWNDFTFAIILMTDQASFTIPVGINAFIERTAIRWGLIQAAGVLITLPPLLIIIFLQRYLLVGFSASRM